jgi:hypothetical protein
MYLIVAPEGCERVERGLLKFGIADLPVRGDRMVLEYPYGAAEAQLRELGFFARRHLTWMLYEFKD